MTLPFNWILIGITVLVSWQAFGNPRLLERLILWPPAIDRQKQLDRLLTHGFIHADWSHLLFNMLTLFFFGGLVERFFAAAAGPLAYPLFYLAAIPVAILPTYLRHRQDARYRSLGASGAVAAVMFAFILLEPWSRIYLFFIPIGIPAVVYAVLYVGYSIWMDRRGRDNVNHSAHLWGAAYGVLVALLAEPALLAHFVQRVLHPTLG